MADSLVIRKDITYKCRNSKDQLIDKDDHLLSYLLYDDFMECKDDIGKILEKNDYNLI